MAKTLNKCIQSSLLSNLFFDRQRMYFCMQAKPSHAHYSCISRCEEKKITWTIYCVNFAAVSLLKTPALSMEPYFKLIEVDDFIFRCLLMLSVMPQARQRDTDDTLTMYIPTSVLKVVVLWKDGSKLALFIQSDKFWTTETISYS